jgi:hypothetical protein
MSAPLFGDDLIEFIEQRGLQIWPVRKTRYGPVLFWYVQNVSPFLQVSDASLKGALQKLQKALQ